MSRSDEIRALMRAEQEFHAREAARYAEILASLGSDDSTIGTEPATADNPRKRRKMSPTARKRISERMKKYWADKQRGGRR